MLIFQRDPGGIINEKRFGKATRQYEKTNHRCSRKWDQKDSGHSCCATRMYEILTILFFPKLTRIYIPCFEQRLSVASVCMLNRFA